MIIHFYLHLLKKNICVFCSSNNLIADCYKNAAFHLGESIAENDHALVYGGATGGLMTSVAKGAHSKGGEIIGVITQSIVKMNRLSPVLSQTIYVNSLAERKAEKKKLTDIFIVLPGGYGTMDEMFDVVASGTLGEHRKPLIIINENGFYNPLLEQMALFKKENCIPKQESYQIEIVQDVDQCIERIINPNI